MENFTLYLVLFLVSLGAAAFFCSAETAFIGMQKLRLQHLIHTGHRKAKLIQEIVERPEKFLATVLLGINFFETAVATLGTVMAVALWGENLGAAIATIVITILTLIFAEFIPKSLAARYGERIALSYAGLIKFISVMLYPFVWMLNHIGLRFTRLIREDEDKHTISEEEFRTAITVGEAEGIWEEEEAEMLHSAFEFADRPVHEVMQPRTEVAWVEQGTTLAKFLGVYRHQPFSRFPVYKKTRDNVVGVLSIKDVLMALANDKLKTDSSIDELVRPVHFVPETKRLGELLAEMRDNKYHIVVVVDEFGGTAGIATLEHLTAEIMGTIGDELAGREEDIVTINANTFEVDGGLRIEEANEELDLDLPEGDYDTVAGFILSHLGRIPKQGEHLRYKDLKLAILEMRDRKIERILVTKEKDAAPAP
ncbi:MAG: HlyC/CorC family transporter [Chloroflexi bacterium]|nr:HlyC/CorC family transporter [Chloroflexota bacterium]MBM3174730.1 HlyC/CorC family transporter [Chloroflexota bacterium]MBM4449997.1 HlyC/CorC family transporter [Chloroflexota bacterium]